MTLSINIRIIVGKKIGKRTVLYRAKAVRWVYGKAIWRLAITIRRKWTIVHQFGMCCVVNGWTMHNTVLSCGDPSVWWWVRKTRAPKTLVKCPALLCMYYIFLEKYASGSCADSLLWILSSFSIFCFLFPDQVESDRSSWMFKRSFSMARESSRIRPPVISPPLILSFSLIRSFFFHFQRFLFILFSFLLSSSLSIPLLVFVVIILFSYSTFISPPQKTYRGELFFSFFLESIL